MPVPKDGPSTVPCFADPNAILPDVGGARSDISRRTVAARVHFAITAVARCHSGLMGPGVNAP